MSRISGQLCTCLKHCWRWNVNLWVFFLRKRIRSTIATNCDSLISSLGLLKYLLQQYYIPTNSKKVEKWLPQSYSPTNTKEVEKWLQHSYNPTNTKEVEKGLQHSYNPTNTKEVEKGLQHSYNPTNTKEVEKWLQQVLQSNKHQSNREVLAKVQQIRLNWEVTTVLHSNRHQGSR